MIQLSETDPRFRKSTYSDGGDECVEVADLAACDCPSGVTAAAPSVHLVRDTTQRHLGALAFPGAAWNGFLAAARR